ncbi:ABC transporter permease [Brachybacterium hainanense]|uniref:ABC transporter permease n=1 Tax=Brachybacterium hainanense TaxID=1541174 RepID=A0ABV6RA42_9MICO
MCPLLRSELTKALTLPSILVTALAALVVPPALAFVTGLSFRPADSRWDDFPVESHGFEVAGFGQPLIILLAALVIGTEFADHQLRTSVTAVPDRRRLLVAKLAVVTGAAALIGAVATSAAVLLKHAALGEHGLPVSEFTTAMAGNLLGVVVNYVLMAHIAAGLTILARSVIAPLVVLVPMVLGLTIGLVPAIPALKYSPDLAGVQLLTGYPGMGLLEPLPGGLVMAAWAAAISLIAAIAWGRRDVSG